MGVSARSLDAATFEDSERMSHAVYFHRLLNEERNFLRLVMNKSLFCIFKVILYKFSPLILEHMVDCSQN